MDALYRLSHEGVERVKGIEPSRSAWEAEVLPLNYTRVSGKRNYDAWAGICQRIWSRFGDGG